MSAHAHSLLSSKFFKLFGLAIVLAFSALALFFTVPLNTLTSAQESNQLQPVNSANTQPCPTCSQPTQRTIYVPTVGISEVEGSNIVLNCRSSHVIEAVPTFYTMEGEAIIGETIQLQPAEMRFVTIKSLIPPAHRGRRTWGGMSMSYEGKAMEVWAQITLHDGKKGGSADVTFSNLNNQGSDTLEGVWYMPKSSKAIIALGNSSNSAILITVQFSNGETQEINIAPFATHYIRRNNNQYVAGSPSDGNGESVKLITTGPSGSLKAAGIVLSSDKKYTSSIRFYDTKSAVQPNLYATNLRLKSHSPRLLLKNTTATSVTARPEFRPTEGTGQPIVLPAITLDPNQLTEVSLESLQSAAATRQDLDSVSVRIDNNGAAGSLIGALYSRDRRTSVFYDVPLRDSGLLRNSTGAYPWRLDQDYTTVVTITNAGNETAEYRASIFYNNGQQYTLKARHLEPNETVKYDLKKLRDEQVPDAQGRVIPLSAMSGQFSWSILRPTSSIRLVGRSEVVSKSNGISSSYSCNICCPDSGPNYFVPTIYVFPGSFADTNVNEEWINCYGWRNLGGPGMLYGLYVTEPAFAGANMVDPGSLIVHGYAEGQVSWISGEYTYWNHYEGPYDCYYEYYPVAASGSIDIQRNNRGRIQAQGSNPRVEVSRNWVSGAVITKQEGLELLDQVWDSLTSSQKRDRQQAYVDARNYIQSSPAEGRPPNGRGGRTFQDPQRRDPTARIDIEIITGLAFRNEDFLW